VSASDHAAQLAWEERFARPAALAAIVAAVLLIAGFLAPQLLIEPADDVATTIVENATAYTAITVGQGLSVALLSVVFYYLYRATKARREIPRVALALGIIGPIGAAAVRIAIAPLSIEAASDYLAAGSVTPEGAAAAIQAGVPQVLLGLVVATVLALGFAFVLISINAMRAGLLSRFMGFLGIALGVLNVLSNVLSNLSVALPAPQFLQLFWTAALGILFLDRWPGGRGPAWAQVEAVPWPTPQQRMEAQQQAARERAGVIDPAGEANGSGARVEDDRPRPTSRKRRRGGG
jgi:hypothetical protein